MKRRRKPRHTHQPPERAQAAIAYRVVEAAPAMSAHFVAHLASPRFVMRAAAPQRTA